MPVPNLTMKNGRRSTSRNYEQSRQKRHRFRYLIFSKPYGVLCQFTDSEGRSTLSDFGPFPAGVYPAGRLDFDSEGLVFLTNDGNLKHQLLEPKYFHPRRYLVQVEQVPTEDQLQQLRDGVIVENKKTLPAKVHLLPEEPILPERSVLIRFRKNVPTAWLKITLREGRNRQVRKMTAAIGHPTLRLVRIAIANFTLKGLEPGQHRNVTESELTELKKIFQQGNMSRRSSQRPPS